MPPYVPGSQTSTLVQCEGGFTSEDPTKQTFHTENEPTTSTAAASAPNKTIVHPTIKPIPKGFSISDWIEETFKFATPLIWVNIIAISLYHIVAVVMFIFFWLDGKILTILFGFVVGTMGGFGVTAGVHRHWCHKAYKAKLPLKIILMICYSVAGQNTIYDWVRDHRVHHKFSETDADPHNSNRGFFFSHVGWLMMRKHPEVLKRGRTVDMTDILEDPVVQFHQKYFLLMKLTFCFILPTLIPVYCWNETWMSAIASQPVVRYIINLNCTWLVNSLAHISGSKPYDKKISPVENKTVAFLAMGEGWHNYHHAFPWDYKAAELGDYSLNLTTFWIDQFAKIGWAYDLKEPSRDLVRKVVEASGDGSHPVFGHEEIPEIQDDVNNIEDKEKQL